MTACVSIYLCNQVFKMCSYTICKAEIVISILLIPLWLKLLHPWNRGIHGYIRSHAKGCFSIALLFCCSHLFPCSSFAEKKKDLKKNHRPSQRFGDSILQLRFSVNSFSKIQEDRLVIKWRWIINSNRYIHSCLLNSELVKYGAYKVSSTAGTDWKCRTNASSVRCTRSLKNNLLPWQRSFIIQIHCCLLPQQESNVP